MIQISLDSLNCISLSLTSETPQGPGDYNLGSGNRYQREELLAFGSVVCTDLVDRFRICAAGRFSVDVSAGPDRPGRRNWQTWRPGNRSTRWRAAVSPATSGKHQWNRCRSDWSRRRWRERATHP